MAEHQLPKLNTRVRFPSSAPLTSRANAIRISAFAATRPVAAVLGLILAFATPIALVATQIPVVDKAAVIDTASDLIAETEWYVPAQHTVSTSSLPGPVASTTSVSLTALF